MPNENLVMQPLYINRQINELMFASSEFGRTWRQFGHFHPEEIKEEITAEDYAEFSEHPMLQGYIKNLHSEQHNLHWSHDSYTWKSAILELARTMQQGLYDPRINRIMTWDLFNFITPGTYDYDSVLELSIMGYDVKKLTEDTNTYIKNYKEAKLNA